MVARSRLASLVFVGALASCGRFGFDDLTTGGGGGDGGGDDADAQPIIPITCPPSYVAVQPLATYTTKPFCVSKYEMRDVGGVAVSQPIGLPWLQMTKSVAIANCQAIGQQLLTNDQWQTIARRAADDGWNWSSGIAYQGVMSAGHSDSNPMMQLAASTDDSPCAFTGNPCSETTWHSQRRTLRFGGTDVIWDLAGNAGEWVAGTYGGQLQGNEFVSMLSGSDFRQHALGNDQSCPSASVTPYCGFGMVFTSDLGGEIVRGSGLDWGDQSGVFSAPMWFRNGDFDWNITFRCAFEP